MRIFLAVAFIFLISVLNVSAQVCTQTGQTPSSAFPVCGVFVFKQNNVPICASHNVPVPGCSGAGTSYRDTNPFWYKFTCYQAGTLGFLITPNDLGDDYDWQLFDITGHNPDDVFTLPGLFVAGNWAGTYGLTGASSAGVGFIQCASNPADMISTFSQMPTLKVGHNYLLLVSHFTNSQSGYQLSFSGGTASITDPKTPVLQQVHVSCDAATVTVVLNKKVLCSSLAADGSDFSISPQLATVTGATGNGCSANFDMDSVTLSLSAALPPGNYKLVMQNGTDANTLLDNCSNEIPVGYSVPFAITPLQPTPLDSIVPVGCTPVQLKLVFSKNIQCSSIAADGSDFQITGPSAVSITGAGGVCSANGLSSSINLSLAGPIQVGGTYQIRLLNGSDGNTIIDECGQMTPAGSTLNFLAKDTVSAQFSYQILYGCSIDTVDFTNAGKNGINHWQWTFDTTGSSTQQNPVWGFTGYGQRMIQVVVSNGVCSDTVTGSVLLDNALKAAIEGPGYLCPGDKAVFTNSSIGNIVSWNWELGDGTTTQQQVPLPHTYTSIGPETTYYVKLIAKNNLGCLDTAVWPVKSLRSCYIAVPNAFTPNGDGINDYLYPLNAFKAVNLEFRVYNRYGQLVFETRDWTRKWDGKINNVPQDTGTYVWTLQYTDGETGKHVFLKGTTVLIR